jgi:hypothetical protein
MKVAFRIFDTLNDIQSDHLPNTRQGQYRHSNPFGVFLSLLQCCAVNLHCCSLARNTKRGRSSAAQNSVRATSPSWSHHHWRWSMGLSLLSDINWEETCHILRYKAGLLQDVGSACKMKLRALFISRCSRRLQSLGHKLTRNACRFSATLHSLKGPIRNEHPAWSHTECLKIRISDGLWWTR